MIAAFVLILSVATVSAAIRARAVGIQAMTGTGPLVLCAHQAAPAAIGLVVSLVCATAVGGLVAYARHGAVAAAEAMRLYGEAAALTAATAIAALIALAMATRPRVRHIGSRRIPFGPLRSAGAVMRMIATVIVMVAIPYSLSLGSAARNAASAAERWSPLGDAVSLSVFLWTDAPEVRDQYVPALGTALRDYARTAPDGALLYVPLRHQLEISDGELGGHDDIVVVSHSYLDAFGIGVDAPGPSGETRSVDIAALPAPTRQLLEAQLPLWRDDGTDSWDGISVAELIDGTIPPLSRSVASARRPLLLVVDDPLETLAADGFLDPAVASRLLAFTDPDALTTAMREAGAGHYVSSMDSVAEAYRVDAAASRTQERAATIAVVAALAISLTTGVLLWSAQHRRAIFAMSTTGIPPAAIWRRPVLVDAVIALGAGIVASALLSPDLRTSTVAYAAPVGFAALYGLTSPLLHTFALRRRLDASIARRD